MWLKDGQHHDWCIVHVQEYRRHAIVYKDLCFENTALLFWDDDKALIPSKHWDMLVSNFSVYDFRASDPDFFEKLEEQMKIIEARINASTNKVH